MVTMTNSITCFNPRHMQQAPIGSLCPRIPVPQSNSCMQDTQGHTVLPK